MKTLGWFFFISSFLIVWAGLSSAQEYSLETDEGNYAFSGVLIEGKPYGNPITLARLLEWEVDYDWPVKRMTITTPTGDKGAILVGYDGYLWNDLVIKLRGKVPVFTEGSLFAPIEVITEVWAPRAGFKLVPSSSNFKIDTFTQETGPENILPEPVAKPLKPDEIAEQEKLLPSEKPRRWVIIDPGHGGGDKGFEVENLKESDLTFEIAEGLKKYLENKYSYSVELTRSASPTGILRNEDRTAEMNSLPGDLVISLHLGGFSDPRVGGWSVFYYGDVLDVSSPELIDPAKDEKFKWKFGDEFLKPWNTAYRYSIRDSIELAGFISKSLSQVLNQKGFGPRPSRLEVLRGTPKPGILVEMGTLSNPEGMRRWMTDGYKEKVIAALGYGIENYIRTKEGKGLVPPPEF